MYRPTSWRTAASNLSRIASPAARIGGRRYASSFLGRTSAKATGTLFRWGLAGAAVYYYNTSNVFAEEPQYARQIQGLPVQDEAYSSIESIAEQRRAQAKQSRSAPAQTTVSDAPSPIESPEGLEEEAQQQGAFNEETGEINWDCPCLGGMAHGPCGEQFRAAFSCFVFSKEEPKGIDCIEHFKTMQNCFREYPDIYGAELTEGDDEDLVEETEPGAQHAVDVARESINDTVEKTADGISADAGKVTQAVRDRRVDAAASTPTTAPTPSRGAADARGSQAALERPSEKKSSLPTSGEDSEGELVPKSWHNTTEDNSKTTSK